MAEDVESGGLGLVLDPGEQGVVGSMVVENLGTAPAELAVFGEGPVLRGQMIIKPEDAVTPALKIYYVVMSIYLAPETFESNTEPFLNMAKELVNAVPSTGVIMADIGEALIGGDYKRALDKCFDLMKYEEYLESEMAKGS